MKDLILFDIDGTLVESSYKITSEQATIINKLKANYDIGVLGGGKLDKILTQFQNLIFFDHYMTECGCVYHKNNSKTKLELEEIYKKNIRDHIYFNQINILIKECLKFLSNVDYILSGHFIDLRNGIIYVSLIGMQATKKERNYFQKLDKINNIRYNLLNILHKKAKELNIFDKVSITEGGSVGIAIYPVEYDKIQVLDVFNDKYNNIYYFGDKYKKNGNDYNIINSPNVKGFKIDNVSDTYNILKDKYL